MTNAREFEQVLEQHGAMLGRIARAFEADPHAQQDLLQEIGFALWRALPGFKGSGSLSAFVAQIAHHVAVDHVARASKRRVVTELSEQMIDPALGPEQRTTEQQSSAQLLQAIRQLPLDQAEVMVLQLEGFSQTEVAQMLGVSANLVGVRASRARERLRVLMAKNPGQSPSGANTGALINSAVSRPVGAIHG